GVDARVGAEALGALDLVLAGGRASEVAAQGGEANAADTGGGGDEGGEGFGLASAQAGAYGEDPSDGGGVSHGGSSAAGGKRGWGETLFQPPGLGGEPPPFRGPPERGGAQGGGGAKRGRSGGAPAGGVGGGGRHGGARGSPGPVRRLVPAGRLRVASLVLSNKHHPWPGRERAVGESP